ncbi:MAG: DUF1178 family protein [Roseovarius sp.]|uniref:DUF1178 family protein n=1 Tax=Roseovarius sp. TaxID=1486281 RepID=UPI0032ECF4AB
MIQYTLKCDKDHRFDSWFQSAAAFDKLQSAGMVACAICGSPHVEKALMAPSVRDSRHKSPQAPVKPDAPRHRPLSAPATTAEQALAELKRHVEKNSEYVGLNFVREARQMHEGTAPERAIYGEAKPEEARKLLEDGVPVAPLPFLPNRKSN